MSSYLSKTDICNLALDYIDEAPITDFDDANESAVVRWFQRNFDKTARTMMRQYAWNFAIKRDEIAALTDVPSFGYKYTYQIPSDCLRVLPLRYCGREDGEFIEYKIEGDKILTNAEAPLKIKYLRFVTDTSLWDDLFVDAFAATLASKVAHFISGKASYAQQLQQTANQFIMEAKKANSMEKTASTPKSDWLIKSRASWGYDAPYGSPYGYRLY